MKCGTKQRPHDGRKMFQPLMWHISDRHRGSSVSQIWKVKVQTISQEGIHCSRGRYQFLQQCNTAARHVPTCWLRGVLLTYSTAVIITILWVLSPRSLSARRNTLKLKPLKKGNERQIKCLCQEKLITAFHQTDVPHWWNSIKYTGRLT